MNDLISKIPGNLSNTAYIVIALIVVIGIVLITRLTGNRSKKVTKYSNISQSGMHNNQNIGENINNKGEE